MRKKLADDCLFHYHGPMHEIPKIISVDDHVVEPPDLWSSRLPAKLRDRGPRIERDRAKFNYVGGVFSYEKGTDDGQWCDWWLYDDLVYPFPRISAAVGFDELDNSPVTFDEIRPGCWKQKERLEDMDANHVDVSICFPNVLPRFCGQTFLERDDKDLALLCVQAYNDWMIDEWCAGDGRGRLIPLTIVPLWDAELAAAEIHRCADKGSFAVTFSENPFHLGLPSFHDPDGFWDPFFQACQDTETVINMHIGSSSKMPSTSSDAPHAVGSVLTFNNSVGSLVDLLVSGIPERFPQLRFVYSEGQVGWMPFVLERATRCGTSVGGAPGTASTRPSHPAPTCATASGAASSTTRPGCGSATRSAWTRSPSRSTTPTATRPSRHQGGGDRAGRQHRPRRRRDLQAVPGQRHPGLRPRAVRHHRLTLCRRA